MNEQVACIEHQTLFKVSIITLDAVCLSLYVQSLCLICSTHCIVYFFDLYQV